MSSAMSGTSVRMSVSPAAAGVRAGESAGGASAACALRASAQASESQVFIVVAEIGIGIDLGQSQLVRRGKVEPWLGIHPLSLPLYEVSRAHAFERPRHHGRARGA